MPSNHTDLKKFAQSARRSLREHVAARLDQVLRTDSAALREREAARKELSQQIAETSKKAVIDRVAYTWFNRFCALRFMDVNRYNRIGVVSPAEGFTQPEILQEAKQGYIDSDLQAFVDCPAVFDLLGGRRPSVAPQQEAYRLLLVGTCNALNKVMSFLFEPIADYTELLMPQDLLSEHSILNDLREAMTPEACQDVEVIGWLYQFYISERKDEVFEALKQNQKIEAEDIPAATQLFTPHWIVRYLVENSLGRLWMLNHPTSHLVEQMDYYIKPVEQETDFLRVTSPEEIKICDPACGSGHMLTYAFDLLYAIYEEEGYQASNIPHLILEKNLYGIEIDERAGALAAFALAMKARGRDRRLFIREAQPQICVLENINFTDQDLEEYTSAMGHDLFTEPLLQTLRQFEQGKNFGSLINPVLDNTNFLLAELGRKGIGGNIFFYQIHKRVLLALKQALYLGSRYHVMITNPPYMGDIGMNEDLKGYVKDLYPDSYSDLFAMFIDRGFNLVVPKGYVGMITMQGWMFQSTYEALRKKIITQKSIASLAHLGPKAFDSIGGEIVSTTAFVIENAKNTLSNSVYLRLLEGNNEAQKARILKESIADSSGKNDHKFVVSSGDFTKIPGSSIAYWISSKLISCFELFPPIGTYVELKAGLSTGDNTRFEKEWYEVEYQNISFSTKDISETITNDSAWYPCNSGGSFRKWYGNHSTIVYWYKNGEIIRNFGSETGKIRSAVRNEIYYFKPGITWTKISSGILSVRYRPDGFIFDDTGRCGFSNQVNITFVLALLCSNVSNEFLKVLSQSLSFTSGEIAKVPFINISNSIVEKNCLENISIARLDWDSFEASWDFKRSALLYSKDKRNSLQEEYKEIRERWHKNVLVMQRLEEENNEVFIDAYGLTTEMTPEVPIEQVSLTCNPHYRYGGNRSEAELEAMLLTDTIREFISYAVGCMFGRYSLDKPGLILANQGETLQDYLHQVSDSTFLPDEDNAIPVLEGEWFSDDITERFKKFLRVTFGEQHYEENLAFIENAIGRDIRSYFTKEFYSQHVRMYQKRPIYWMFSSPKGSFNVLIYMHRYQPDTLSVILNRYLREFRGKLEGRKAHLEQVSISASSTQREKTAALKEIEGLNKTLEEIRVYERDILYPLAVQGIQIDLDDGVKVNYKKFGKALAKVNGLSD